MPEEFEYLLSDAIELAINECLSEDVLTGLLRKQRAEVFNMSLFEFNEELYRRNLEKYLEEKCKAKVMAEAMSQGMAEGMERGRAQGIILLGKKYGLTKEEIIQNLMEECQLQEEEVLELYEKG